MRFETATPLPIALPIAPLPAERWPLPAGPGRPVEALLRAAGSVGLHLLLLAAALWLAVARPLENAGGPAMDVEMVSGQELAALAAKLPPLEAAAPPAAPSIPLPAATDRVPQAAPLAPSQSRPAGRSTPSVPDMVEATRLYAEKVLDDPKSRSTRRQLASLGDDDRIAQLCNLEAMEQIHAWQGTYQPDRLVDYAMSESRMKGDILVVDGGAFRSHLNWYEVSYHCELDAARHKVVAFAFRVGESIPKADWSHFNLPARF
ncbi:DUF930 domain-containing protein [Ancylobacter terrae]|uniref:DUF930 domain-containing protein n=1 Tax=Ancylobacter sp. sgz301288 TaxID=3342077 RepID=UPI00385A8CCC